MKDFLKLLLLIGTMTCFISVRPSSPVLANETFSKLKDDQKLIQAEEGGYFTGSGIVTEIDENGNVTDVIDLDHPYENGAQVISGKQYKDDFKAKQIFSKEKEDDINEKPMKSGFRGEGVVTTTDENDKVIDVENLSSLRHKISNFFSNLFD